MDSKTFLGELISEIEEYGIDKKITDKYINSFAKYFDTLGEEEAVKYIEGCDSPKQIARNIAQQCGITSNPVEEKNATEERAEITDSTEDDGKYENVTVSDVSAENVPDTENAQATDDTDSEKTRVIQSVSDNEEGFGSFDIEATATAIEVKEDTSDEDEVYLDFVTPANKKVPMGTLPDSAELPQDYVEAPDVDFNELEAEERSAAVSENDEAFVEDEPKEKIPFTWLYLLVCIASAPLILPLLGVIFVAFGIIFACFALGIVACVAVLIGIIIAGTAISLVGIIYGVTQIFSSLPIGLYEIGLGVIAGGIAMFTGILIYNFAIRLLPFIMRKLGEFIGFFTGKVGELYRYVKGMCAERV